MCRKFLLPLFIFLLTFLMISAQIEINNKEEISVLPNMTATKPNDLSKGFRILSDKFEDDVNSVDVQGLGCSKNVMKIYFAGDKVQSVENVKIISFDGLIYKLEVKFEKFYTKYVNKTIKIKTSHN